MNPFSVISLPAGRNQKPLIDAARNLNYTVLAVDCNPKLVSGDQGVIPVCASTHDLDETWAALSTLLANVNLQGIICRSSGPPIMTAALLAEKLCIEGWSHTCALAALDKSALGKIAHACGVRSIPGRISSSSQLSVPFNSSERLVVKPNQPITGKVNIRIVAPEDISEDLLQTVGRGSLDGLALIQPFIEGKDIGVLLLMAEGRCVFSTLLDEIVELDGKKIIGKGVRGPSKLCGTPIGQKLLKIAIYFAGIHAHNRGFLFLTFRVDSAGDAWLYEVNPGLAGDKIAEFLLPVMWPKADWFSFEVLSMCGRLDIEEVRSCLAPPPRPAELMQGQA